MTTRSYCTFYVAELFVGIDVQQVQEVLREQPMTTIPLAPATVAGLINLRGQIVTAIDLRTRLGLPPLDAAIRPANVVVRDREAAVSLLVDRICDVIEVDEQLREPPPLTVREEFRPLLSGAYKLPGQMLLVLDYPRLLDDPHPPTPLRRRDEELLRSSRERSAHSDEGHASRHVSKP
jgi:purine-binding chemotaxis protein CheW